MPARSTAGRVARAEPRETEGRYLMADNAPLMLWVTGADGACTFLSQSWYDFTGQSEETALGFGWLEAAHPDDRALAEQSFLAATVQYAAFRLDYRIRRVDGEYRWAIDSGAPRFAEDGTFLGYIGAVIDITDRKHAEEALRSSEAKFATAFNAGPIILTITRLADGRFVEVNESFLNTSGYAREEVLGRTPLELGIWVRPEQRVAGLEELRRGRRVREVEADFRTKNGRIFTCLISAELIQADGQLCVLTALTDITARKQADALLERYHLLSRRARDIVLFIRPDGQIVDANQAAMSAYGYDRATLLTMRIYDLRDSSPIPLVSEQMARANESGLLFEAIHRRSDGSTFPVEVSSIGADIGGQRLLLSIIRDISERRRAEEEARVLADLTELIRLTEDPDELLWQASRALGEYLNVRRCFFIDIDVPNNYAVAHRQYCRDVPPVPSEYQVSDYSEQARSEIAAGRTIINCDSQIDPRTAASYERTYRPYGERAYVAVPLLREGRWEAMLWVSTDEPREWRPREVALLESVAERAWMAVEKLRLYAAEQRARALAEAAVRARDQFLQVASHELKTPLTALLGNAQLFERRTSRDGTLSERDRRAVRTIADQAARLDQMISALLDITRFDAGQVTLNRERIDLAALLRRVIDDLRPALMRHAIDLTGVASLPVEGDPMRLEQVFRNLLSNAVKYSPAGGRVSVRLDARDSSATVEVADEGVGIPPDALPHLFDRFFRVDSAATQRIDGTGLGLYVVREIVALHGGDVTATSEVGVGSVFTVSLPLKSRML